MSPKVTERLSQQQQKEKRRKKCEVLNVLEFTKSTFTDVQLFDTVLGIFFAVLSTLHDANSEQKLSYEPLIY